MVGSCHFGAGAANQLHMVSYTEEQNEIRSEWSYSFAHGGIDVLALQPTKFASHNMLLLASSGESWHLYALGDLA